MSYLLDANACIQYLNGRSEHLRQQLSNKRAEEIVLCSVVKAELYFGAQKSLKPERNLKEIRKFFNRFTSIPFDDAAAEAYGRIRSQLEKLGTPIGPNDLLIAAIAVAKPQCCKRSLGARQCSCFRTNSYPRSTVANWW